MTKTTKAHIGPWHKK